MTATLTATRSEFRQDLKRYLDAIEAGATVSIKGSGTILADVSPEASERRAEKERLQRLFMEGAGSFVSDDGLPLDIDAVLATKGE